MNHLRSMQIHIIHDASYLSQSDPLISKLDLMSELTYTKQLIPLLLGLLLVLFCRDTQQQLNQLCCRTQSNLAILLLYHLISHSFEILHRYIYDPTANIQLHCIV